jgi:hypothetical protein
MIGYYFVYAVTAKSSLKVLSELLRVADAPVDNLAETRDGFVVSISIPGVPNTGAIYAYDRPTASMHNFTVDGRDSDFSADEIALMFPAVVKHLNEGIKATSTGRPESANKQPEKNSSQRYQQNRRHNRSRRKPAVAGVSVRPEPVQVAA